MIDEQSKHMGDVVAIATGGTATLTQWSEFAGQLTPILSLVFVSMSILWLAYRFHDRIRFGPKGDRE